MAPGVQRRVHLSRGASFAPTFEARLRGFTVDSAGLGHAAD